MAANIADAMTAISRRAPALARDVSRITFIGVVTGKLARDGPAEGPSFPTMETHVLGFRQLSSQWETLEFTAPVDKSLDASSFRHAAIVFVEPHEPTKIS